MACLPNVSPSSTASVATGRSARQIRRGDPRRTGSYSEAKRIASMPAPGRSETVESERNQFDRRRSQFDPKQSSSVNLLCAAKRGRPSETVQCSDIPLLPARYLTPLPVVCAAAHMTR